MCYYLNDTVELACLAFSAGQHYLDTRDLCCNLTGPFKSSLFADDEGERSSKKHKKKSKKRRRASRSVSPSAAGRVFVRLRWLLFHVTV